MKSTREKAARPDQGLKAAEGTTLKSNNTPLDPLRAWFDLAASVKPSRTERKQKRGWKRGHQ